MKQTFETPVPLDGLPRERGESNGLDFAEIRRKIDEQSYFHAVIGEERIAELNALLTGGDFRPHSPEWAIDTAHVDSLETRAKVWEIISSGDQRFFPVNFEVNYFKPGGYTDKHIDFGAETLVVEPELEIEKAWTFLLVLAGTKIINLYTQGAENPPEQFVQVSGDLLIFPLGFTVDNHTYDTIYEGLYHEVPVQDATCLTAVWDLEDRSEIKHLEYLKE